VSRNELLSLDALLDLDLEYVSRMLEDEFARMSGCSLIITGGAGFLGYYFTLSALYWNRTHGNLDPIQVIVVDNFRRGVPGWLDDVDDDPNLSLLRADVSRLAPGELPLTDYVIHAAGIASPRYYREFPLETIDANVDGLRSLLDAYRGSAEGQELLKGFLYLSSSEIYGDPPADEIPTNEDFRGFVSCTGPRACYDESKRLGETISVVYAQKHELPVSIARPFNNYGPGLKISDQRVLPDFMRDAFEGRDITLLSDGSPTRTFCYVADAVVGYYKVLVRGRKGESYNVGTESPEVSMRHVSEQVADMARAYIGFKGVVRTGVPEEKDYLTDNPNRRCPIIEKARRELGYDPSIDLQEGLFRLMSWYRSYPTGEDA
jgi:nucleoside-diphosphate-sugar epimerase